jgi:hypothetical protein
MLVTTGTDGRETSVAAPPSAEIAQRATALGDGAWLQWGTAPVGVTAITSVAADGTRTDATLVAWPDGFPSFPDEPTLDGSIWYAPVPEVGALETSPAGPRIATASPAGEQLHYAMVGTATVATGHDLGVDWEVRAEDGTVTLTANGPPIGSAGSFQSSGGGQWDVDVGTLLFYLQPLSVASMTAVIDRSDAPDAPDQVAGRWMPATDALGHETRLWLLPIPGQGTGTVQVDDELPTFVSWPTHDTVMSGDVLMAGSDGRVSWGLTWVGPGCVVEAIARSVGDAGAVECPGPYEGGDVLVRSRVGSQHAISVIVGPTGMTGRTDDRETMLVCNDLPPSAGAWSGSAACVAVVPVGAVAQVELTGADWNPIGDSVTLDPAAG